MRKRIHSSEKTLEINAFLCAVKDETKRKRKLKRIKMFKTINYIKKRKSAISRALSQPIQYKCKHPMCKAIFLSKYDARIHFQQVHKRPKLFIKKIQDINLPIDKGKSIPY